jgi:hypothetical protein
MHADDVAICTEYNYRSNTLFAEKLCCSSNTGARFDSHDVATFGRENSADGHFRLPMPAKGAEGALTGIDQNQKISGWDR